ncbi:MAG: hypothetical protein ACUVTW_01315 [Thermogutta sp.]
MRQSPNNEEVIAMEPYPIEVVAACDTGRKTRAVALKYRMGESWVCRSKPRWRENGEIAARKAGSTPPPKWRPHADKIAETVPERPDATPVELRQILGFD